MSIPHVLESPTDIDTDPLPAVVGLDNLQPQELPIDDGDLSLYASNPDLPGALAPGVRVDSRDGTTSLMTHSAIR